jgi:hypothetical protein
MNVEGDLPINWGRRHDHAHASVPQRRQAECRLKTHNQDRPWRRPGVSVRSAVAHFAWVKTRVHFFSTLT